MRCSASMSSGGAVSSNGEDDDARDAGVDGELAELQRAYRAELPAKIGALAAAVTARDANTAAALAHRLRGTAGAYGLSEVSAAAGAIEDALGGAPEWPTIDRLVGDLTTAAGR